VVFLRSSKVNGHSAKTKIMSKYKVVSIPN